MKVSSILALYAGIALAAPIISPPGSNDASLSTTSELASEQLASLSIAEDVAAEQLETRDPSANDDLSYNTMKKGGTPCSHRNSSISNCRPSAESGNQKGNRSCEKGSGCRNG